MTNDDHPRFACLVAALALPLRQEVTETLIEGYWMGLDDLPLATVEAAVRRASRECKFMPAPSELRELAGCKARRDVAPSYYLPLPRERRRTARERGWPEGNS